MLEGTQNDEKKFFQKCEKWMKFLEKMKEALKTDIPGRFEELQEQQRVYEVKLTLKMEAASWMMKAGGKSLENAVHFEIRSGQDFTEHFTLEMPIKRKTLKHENPFPKWTDPFFQGSDL